MYENLMQARVEDVRDNYCVGIVDDVTFTRWGRRLAGSRAVGLPPAAAWVPRAAKPGLPSTCCACPAPHSRPPAPQPALRRRARVAARAHHRVQVLVRGSRRSMRSAWGTARWAALGWRACLLTSLAAAAAGGRHGWSCAVLLFTTVCADSAAAPRRGMGSDGTVGANKEAVKIIASQEGMFAQVGRAVLFPALWAACVLRGRSRVGERRSGGARLARASRLGTGPAAASKAHSPASALLAHGGETAKQSDAVESDCSALWPGRRQAGGRASGGAAGGAAGDRPVKFGFRAA